MSLPVKTPPAASAAASFVRLLYTQNPFYLIGTLLVLVGLQQCFGKEATLATSGWLVGMLAAYTLLLAAIAAVIIRWGRIWDDARTILLVIVLLFFMLSTSLDFHLLFTLEPPVPGSLLLGGGWLFSILLSELLLRGLRIALAARYRGPYYLILTLLFGYPVLLGWIDSWGWHAARSWTLLSFPAAGALALLTLVPAARTRRRFEPATGTPWIWPYYPWSLFAYLTIGLAIRSWWLTISFEPAKGADMCFRPYFLVPLVIAWSVLIVEMGKSHFSLGTMAAGMLLPLTGLLLAFPGPAQNPVEVAFLGRLTAALGSPPQLVVWSMLAFYGWTWLRRIPGSEPIVLALGVFSSLLGRHTLDWQTLTLPQPFPLAAVAALVLVQAVRLESTWRALTGGALIVAAARLAGARWGGESLWFWQWHAPLAAALLLPAVFNDPLAKLLRQIAWRAVPAIALASAAVYPFAMPNLPDATLSGYLAVLLVASLAMWTREREVLPLAAALGTLSANALAHARQFYLLLGQTPLADGLPWLACGLAVVLIALAISLLKMGLGQRAWQWLERINLALRGGLS
jgi:hypothetical protein